MKKQLDNKHKNCPADPTCGNCIHNPGGRRCSIYKDWAVLPTDQANSCEYHFPRVEQKYLKYYKMRPTAPRGWLWDPQIFQKMMQDLWEYIKDTRKGIVTDNNGGYFTRWPFNEKIVCST